MSIGENPLRRLILHLLSSSLPNNLELEKEKLGSLVCVCVCGREWEEEEGATLMSLSLLLHRRHLGRA